MELFDDSTSINQDLFKVVAYHKLYLDDETIDFYVKLLHKASKEGKSILNMLDEIILCEKEKRYESKKGTYRNKKGKRDFNRENLLRTMRTHNLTEFEALKYIDERAKRIEEIRRKPKAKKPEIDLLEGYTIYSDKGTFNFKNKSGAVKYLTENYGYSESVSRSIFNRNLKTDKMNINGWCAFFLKKID